MGVSPRLEMAKSIKAAERRRKMMRVLRRRSAASIELLLGFPRAVAHGYIPNAAPRREGTVTIKKRSPGTVAT